MRSRLFVSLTVAAVTSVTLGTAPSAGAQIPGLPPLPTPQQVLAPVLAMLPPEALAAVGSSAPTGPAFQDITRPLQEAVLGEVNAWRSAHGLVVLGPNPGLAGTAQGWADRLGATGRVEHNQDVLRRGMGENIVIAPADCGARCLVDLWKNSPGHNENLLDPGYRSAGVGVARNASGMLVVVQDYAY